MGRISITLDLHITMAKKKAAKKTAKKKTAKKAKK
jgi:hypothetical protein